MYQETIALKKILALKKRIKIIQGGTSAGKTVGILQVLIDKAQRDTDPCITSIVSETYPHLKKGSMRDFLDILEKHKYYDPNRWNKTESIYTFETGSRIEFFSADQPGKVRGPRRKRLFINEANNIPFETFEQLEVRTSDDIWIDYNPVKEFWVHDNIVDKRSDYDMLVLTYKDNEALPQTIVQSIESRRHRKAWWQVYGLGLVGEIEAQIYKNWKMLEGELPHEARLERRWVDFGYTNDPTSIGDLYYWNGAYIVDQLLYRRGMSNKLIADFLLAQNLREIMAIADSAEPKSIDEIASYGITIIGCQKGKGSVTRGIDCVQAQKIFITKRSVETLREYRNYIWMTDKNGKIINEEDPGCANHSMSGIRYAISSLDPDFGREQLKVDKPTSEFSRKNTDYEPDYGGGQRSPFHYD